MLIIHELKVFKHVSLDLTTVTFTHTHYWNQNQLFVYSTTMPKQKPNIFAFLWLWDLRAFLQADEWKSHFLQTHLFLTFQHNWPVWLQPCHNVVTCCLIWLINCFNDTFSSHSLAQSSHQLHLHEQQPPSTPQSKSIQRLMWQSLLPHALSPQPPIVKPDSTTLTGESLLPSWQTAIQPLHNKWWLPNPNQQTCHGPPPRPQPGQPTFILPNQQ